MPGWTTQIAGQHYYVTEWTTGEVGASLRSRGMLTDVLSQIPHDHMMDLEAFQYVTGDGDRNTGNMLLDRSAPPEKQIKLIDFSQDLGGNGTYTTPSASLKFSVDPSQFAQQALNKGFLQTIAEQATAISESAQHRGWSGRDLEQLHQRLAIVTRLSKAVRPTYGMLQKLGGVLE